MEQLLKNIFLMLSLTIEHLIKGSDFMRNRRITFSLLMIMLLSFMLPILTYASTTIMDYRKLVSRNIKQHGIFDTPLSNFEVYVNGEYVGETNVDKFNTSFAEDNYGQLESSGIKVKLGDKITIKDKSTIGSGSKISYYDLQVSKGIVNNIFTTFDSYTNINQTITADMVGDLVIFLNVRDNYNKIPNFENFSQYGNWRSEYLKASGQANIQIKGWYFTALKLTVDDFSNPIVEFEIHYEGKNKTDNINDPIELESYPAMVDLKDKTIVEKGSIKTWEWERQVSDTNWVPIGNSQNLKVPINENIEIFRLRVENTDGVWSEWVRHAVYSQLKEEEFFYDDEEIIPEPIVPVYNTLRSPNVAVKWDTVPIKISASSTVTGKIQRDPITTWNEYKYTVPSNAKPGTVLIVKLEVLKRIDQAKHFPIMIKKPRKPAPPKGDPPSAGAMAAYYEKLEIWREKMIDLNNITP